ncbi:MAG: nucleotidyltransferase family protein [Rubrivivax sp.]|nr:nucleotidyltransferase family protein [Rubrivivax sp.]
MEACRDFAAIVLAAGRSSRMGAFKPLLPFGEGTVIERVLSMCAEAEVGAIRVVVGWNAERLIPLLEGRGVPWVRNAKFAEGMYSSLQLGVKGLPDDVEAFFVLPGDMPLVRAETFRRLAAVWGPGQARVLYPCFAGRRGHPPLIAASLIPAILGEAPAGGLRELLACHATEAHDVDCDDPGMLVDIDTPKDYEKAVQNRQANTDNRQVGTDSSDR